MEKLQMYENPTKGILISFCGLDGCGKTTMIQKLNEVLISNGVRTNLTKQPTNAVRQSSIFRTYMDCEDNSAYDYMSLSLLAASDRVQHSSKVISPLLGEGITVITDRYFYSCLANLRARGYKNDRWIYEISKYIIKPDISFFLDVSVETAIERVRARPEEKEKYIDVPLQYALHDEYLEIAKMNGGIVIENETEPEKTFKRILEEYYGYLERSQKNRT